MGAWLRSAILIAAMAIVGFLGVWQASGLYSGRGGLGPTILQSVSPMHAIISVVLTIGAASIVGGCIARMSTPATGMFVLGFSLYAMAMMLDGVTEFITAGGSSNLLILEAVLLAIVIYIGTIVVFTIGGTPKSDFERTSSQHFYTGIGKTILISIAMLPIVLLVAASPLKGQVIGSTMLGGIAIGIFARLFIPNEQPVEIYSLPVAIGGVGYLIAMLIGATDVVAFAKGGVSALYLPMPMEYAAGAVMGVSIGLGWAASLAESHETQTA